MALQLVSHVPLWSTFFVVWMPLAAQPRDALERLYTVGGGGLPPPPPLDHPPSSPSNV